MAVLVVVVPAAPATASPFTAGGLDGYRANSGAPCANSTRPGTAALGQLLGHAYPGIGANVGVRSCSANQYLSDHSRGLAVDWSTAAGSSTGQQFLDWLFEGDGQGNNHVRLRRLGISYIIWNSRIWTASVDQSRTSSNVATWRNYDPSTCFAKYGRATDCAHVRHMHISLSDAGGSQTSSWWQSVMDGHRDGPTTPSGPIAQDLSVRHAPSAVIDPSDLISLYAVRADGNLWGASQPSAGAGLNPWSIIASSVGSLQGRPAVLRLDSGVIAVYARTTEGTIVGTNQVTVGGAFADWTEIGTSGHGITSDPVAIQLSSGVIAVYASTVSGTVSGVSQSSPGGLFGSWTTISSSPHALAGRPAVVRYADDRIVLFARGSDNQIHTAAQTAPGSAFNTWAPLGSGGGGITTEPAAAIDADRITVFAGAGGSLATVSQSIAAGSFGGWANLGAGGTPVGSATPAVVKSPGLTSAYALGDDRTVWGTSVTPTQSTYGWAQIGTGSSLATSLTGLRTASGVNCVYGADTSGRVVGTCQTGPGQGFGAWAVLL